MGMDPKDDRLQWKKMKIMGWTEFIDMVHNPDSLNSVR